MRHHDQGLTVTETYIAHGSNSFTALVCIRTRLRIRTSAPTYLGEPLLGTFNTSNTRITTYDICVSHFLLLVSNIHLATLHTTVCVILCSNISSYERSHEGFYQPDMVNLKHDFEWTASSCKKSLLLTQYGPGMTRLRYRVQLMMM